jgi:hypothetical protein
MSSPATVPIDVHQKLKAMEEKLAQYQGLEARVERLTTLLEALLGAESSVAWFLKLLLLSTHPQLLLRKRPLAILESHPSFTAHHTDPLIEYLSHQPYRHQLKSPYPDTVRPQLPHTLLLSRQPLLQKDLNSHLHISIPKTVRKAPMNHASLLQTVLFYRVCANYVFPSHIRHVKRRN